ncbi:hypothetical protein AOLI_G00047710 [Acnodon oligacanthus]
MCPMFAESGCSWFRCSFPPSFRLREAGSPMTAPLRRRRVVCLMFQFSVGGSRLECSACAEQQQFSLCSDGDELFAAAALRRLRVAALLTSPERGWTEEETEGEI